MTRNIRDWRGRAMQQLDACPAIRGGSTQQLTDSRGALCGDHLLRLEQSDGAMIEALVGLDDVRRLHLHFAGTAFRELAHG